MKVSSKLFMVAVLLISMLAPSALAAEFGVFDDEVLSVLARTTHNELFNSTVSPRMPLSEEELPQVFAMHLDGMGRRPIGIDYDYIYSLSGMEYMTGLQSLTLTDQQFTDMTPITQLEHLQWVDLSNSLISEVPDLREMASLTTLDLSYNMLTDFEITAIPNSLWKLDLSNNHISDISIYYFTTILLQNSQLQFLDLRDNPLSNDSYETIYQMQADHPDLEILFDAPVPEPAVMSLMLAGGILLKRRRR